MIKFEKVSLKEFLKDWKNVFGEKFSNEEIEEIYDGITIPKRATVGSAGYDFVSPIDVDLKVGETILIPTGIRSTFPKYICLFLFPRSGLGFKFRLQLNNTIGVIDSDYYSSSNEGHIMAKITNDSNEYKVCKLEKGKGFIQGVFMNVLFANDDDAEVRNIKRDGGFGSTNKGV